MGNIIYGDEFQYVVFLVKTIGKHDTNTILMQRKSTRNVEPAKSLKLNLNYVSRFCKYYVFLSIKNVATRGTRAAVWKRK